MSEELTHQTDGINNDGIRMDHLCSVQRNEVSTGVKEAIRRLELASKLQEEA